MSPTAAVKALDHIVLTVSDISATVAFYEQHLGMKHESFSSPKEPGTVRHALVFGRQKINLHKSGAEFEPKAQNVTPGSGDLCFVTDTPVDQVLEGFKNNGVEVLEGGRVVDRTGAVGPLRSVYVRDVESPITDTVLGHQSDGIGGQFRRRYVETNPRAEFGMLLMTNVEMRDYLNIWTWWNCSWRETIPYCSTLWCGEFVIERKSRIRISLNSNDGSSLKIEIVDVVDTSSQDRNGEKPD